jgi:hypothetical protein
MRTHPFRGLERFAQQVLGMAARPAVMPMDARKISVGRGDGHKAIDA